MAEYTESEKQSLLVAGGVIVFTIVAIIAYVYTKGGLLFYIIAILALALEFYMAYRISKEAPKKEAEKKARKARK